jgi:ACS family hexuronate transporter-like MFS transporter
VVVAALWWGADRNPPFAVAPASAAPATAAAVPSASASTPVPMPLPAPATVSATDVSKTENSSAVTTTAAAATPGFFDVFGIIARTPRLRGIVVARIISDPFYFFLMNWHVGFLQEHWKWNLGMVGRFMWIPWVVIPLANMGAAFLSDRRAAGTGDPAGARSFTLRCFACLAPAAALAPFVSHSPAIVIPLITLSFLMTNGWNALSGVMVSELAPRGTIATCIGILSALSGLASIAFNQVAGVLVDHFGYTLLFVAGACLHPLAALILWLSEPRKKG